MQVFLFIYFLLGAANDQKARAGNGEREWEAGRVDMKDRGEGKREGSNGEGETGRGQQ